MLVREVPDESAAVMALIENIQREDLNPLEEAQGLKRLVDEFGMTHEVAAQAVGRSRSAASNLLRLLNLAAPVQQLLMAGDLDMGHARALLTLEPAQQILNATEIVAKKMSVRDAEKLVARSQVNGRQTPLLRVKKEKRGDVARLEEQLADKLAAVVEIRMLKKTRHGESGEIAISFGSNDELERPARTPGARRGAVTRGAAPARSRRVIRSWQVAGDPSQRCRPLAGVNCQASRPSVSLSPKPAGDDNSDWPDNEA